VIYNRAVSTKLITLCLLCILLGCSGEPPEETVSHPSSTANDPWLRSDYNIVAREVKEYDDHSGSYIVLTIKHGKKKITAECATTWITDTGEDMPSTVLPYDKCRELPMGAVKLERTSWDYLYYFSGSGKRRQEIALIVKKIEIQ
jgi:hypothetical protein